MSGPSDAVGDMPAEEFRSFGHEVVDWIADYLADPERYPVLSQAEPGSIAAALPAHPPQSPESMEAILQDFRDILLPGITHWNAPGFFAYFANTASGPGILGEMLTAALNANGMLWRTSPAATELEEVTLDWLRAMVGLPAEFRGVITDTASVSSLLAIAAARQAIPEAHIRQSGMSGRADLSPLTLYTSDQAHSSIEKGAITLGVGQEGVRKVASDVDFRMDAAQLEAAIREDRAAGLLPFCVVATAGTTSSTSIDPIPEIARICQKEKLWLHVDAAYGGSAAIVPELRFVLDGAEHADSLVVNPHKWLFTPMDCSVLYVRDPEQLKRAFRLTPDYLTTTGDVTNYMDWGVQLGRRFRALKLWMVIRRFGRQGLIANIREHVRLAQLFAGWVDESPSFERLAPAPLSVVCFRARPSGLADETAVERLNEELLEQINRTGEAFLSHTRLCGVYSLRLAIGNMRTQERHVRRVWDLLNDLVKELS